jgi:hypothetical protein
MTTRHPMTDKTSRIAWIARTKLKVLAWLLGITLASFGSTALAGLPLLAVLPVAVAAAAVSIGKTTTRLSRTTCLDCGADLTNQPIGSYGAICHACGSVNQPRSYSA